MKPTRRTCCKLALAVAVSSTAYAADEQQGAQPAQPVAQQQDPCAGAAAEDRTRPRRRPGYPIITFDDVPCDPDRAAPPRANLLADPPPVPDRWRIVDTLGFEENLWDPYSGNNPLKADKPVLGEDWFFNALVISDTVLEPRKFPTPVANASTERTDSNEVIGQGDQFLFNQNIIAEFVLYKGDTVFKPPDHEFRIVPVLNWNYVDTEETGFLKANPELGSDRSDNIVALQQFFYDYHIRDSTPRYDFESIRIGIQPFSNDFRGFLFQDQQFGVRWFGVYDNAIYQYNLAWFRRIEKDTNSGLNDVDEGLRDDDVFIANLYIQDLPQLGFASEVSVIYNRNREKDDFFFDNNQIIARPSSLGLERGRDYDVVYLGYNGDGHFDRWNLSTSLYVAVGEESNGTFVNEETDILSYQFAAEVSRDYDWVRLRGSFFHASGDDDPFDTDATGFDSIFDNPQFAGGDTSFWIRQAIPLIGGGKVQLVGRNSLLPALRSSKEQGQSSFSNPGLTLIGVGADFDLSPETRISFNVNQLWFDETEVLEVARAARAGIDSNIGTDVSVALIWRPFATQNIVWRLSGAALIPGRGWEDLFGSGTPYSILGNLVLQY